MGLMTHIIKQKIAMRNITTNNTTRKNTQTFSDLHQIKHTNKQTKINVSAPKQAQT